MQRRTGFAIASGVLLAALAPVFAQQGGQGTGAPRVGAPAPEFNLFDLKGQVFVLEFLNPTDQQWAKLHKTARFRSDGKLEQIRERYKDQDVVWLAICPFERTTTTQQGQTGQTSQVQGLARLDPRHLRSAIADLDLNFPVLMDEGGASMKTFGITQIPYLVVVDGNGTITYTDRIQMSGDEVVGLDTFDRAIGTAINATRSGSVPAGAPREPQQERR